MIQTSDKKKSISRFLGQKNKTTTTLIFLMLFMLQVAITSYNSNELYFKTFKSATTLLFNVQVKPY